MALARCRSGYLRGTNFVREAKSFFTVPALCLFLLPIYWTAGVFPWGSVDVEIQDLACDILMRKGQMDVA
ncbi:hypothetical protein TNCV_2148581 [Trichonephila clavipes]|uniref:Uncharacterized protein n=1 Tax=Trichonephila clavipes TaxID=2585209 RepID=A0A8X6VSP9_TRICX|nr:hypothetical protein TNCV_2148581 [Trichonephila clavipes]